MRVLVTMARWANSLYVLPLTRFLVILLGTEFSPHRRRDRAQPAKGETPALTTLAGFKIVAKTTLLW